MGAIIAFLTAAVALISPLEALLKDAATIWHDFMQQSGTPPATLATDARNAAGDAVTAYEDVHAQIGAVSAALQAQHPEAPVTLLHATAAMAVAQATQATPSNVTGKD